MPFSIEAIPWPAYFAPRRSLARQPIHCGCGFACEARVFDGEGDSGAGMLRRVEDDLAVVLVKLRLEERAVDGLMEEGWRDAL